MRPVPVEDAWIGPQGRRLVIGPPRGEDLTGEIRAIEAVAYLDPEGGSHVAMPFLLEEADFEAWGIDPAQRGLFEGRPIVWVHFMGLTVIPFDLSTFAPIEYQVGDR